MKLTTYRALSRLPWPSSYLGKFLLTAFVGVHVPLIAVVCYAVFSLGDLQSVLPVLLVALIATLVGTVATMLVQGQLLAPVLATSRALEAYRAEKRMPELPQEYMDEAGRLMRDAQGCIVHLAELLRLKNDLLAVASHDARSPLTSILFATQMTEMALQDERPDVEELREMNDMVRDAARRQLDLLNGTLTLARADSGRIAVDAAPAELGALLRRAAQAAGPQAQQKGVELRVDIAGDEVHALVDVAKTEQVLANLIGNAIKFTPRGGEVAVGVEPREGCAAIRVSDTGVGMTDDQLAELFKPFSSAHRQGTEKEPGTGLGLWICRTFAELQGGRVRVDSAPGRGSTFTVELPLAGAAVPAAA